MIFFAVSFPCGRLFFVSKMVVSGPLLMCVAPLVGLHRVSIIFNFFPWVVASFTRFQICWRFLGLGDPGCSVQFGLDRVWLFIYSSSYLAIQFFNISLSSPSFGLHLFIPIFSFALLLSRRFGGLVCSCAAAIRLSSSSLFCPTRWFFPLRFCLVFAFGWFGCVVPGPVWFVLFVCHQFRGRHDTRAVLQQLYIHSVHSLRFLCHSLCTVLVRVVAVFVCCPVPFGLFYLCAISFEVVMTQGQSCNNSIFIQYIHCVSFAIVSVLSWCVWSPFLWCVCVRPVSRLQYYIRRWWWWLFPLASVLAWHFFFARFVCCHLVVPLCGFFHKAIFQFSQSFQIFSRISSQPSFSTILFFFCSSHLVFVGLRFCLVLWCPVPCGLFYLCAISFLSRSS